MSNRSREASPLSGSIAIAGMACRFPGANTPAEFWRNLAAGKCSVTEIPTSRFDVDPLYDPKPGVRGKTSTRWGGFVSDFDRFDCSFFGISPKEAASLDPQQRWLLEAAWESLEDAGLAAESLAGTSTGVFVGACNGDYAQLFRPNDSPANIDAYYGTGNAASFAAGRLSYVLGVHGSSMVVDTACSSSLVAVHLACRSLLSGECDLALAAGVNGLFTPSGFVYVSQVHAVAHDGVCKAFSADADGYVRAEGCGVIVLMRLEDALASGTRVLAVIRGSAVNHDGRSSTLTAPNRHAQVQLLRSALESAGVAPKEIGYVEAHGTGTALGDPIEAAALSAALCEGRTTADPLLVGSVKTNLGHLEAAAGIAGLIKIVLCLEHGEIVPHLHVRELSPHIRQYPILTPDRLMPWPRNGAARRAGVSSFGFSGTNAHVILEEAPPAASAPCPPAMPALLLPISARSEGSLGRLVDSYSRLLDDPSTDATAVCQAAALRRSHHRLRVAVSGGDADQLRRALDACHRGADPSRTGVVFVYPGQGGQWSGMDRELRQNVPAFARAFDRCREALLAAGGGDLLEERAEEDIAHVQASIWAMECALTEVWRSWGIEPQAVVGHSMGEAAAAWAAGVLTLEESARVMVERGRLLAEQVGQGAMLAVEAGRDLLTEWMADWGLELAAENSPRWSVVSGNAEVVERFAEWLDQRGVGNRRLRTSGVAGHCRAMEELAGRLDERLRGLEPRTARVRMVSTVTGERVEGSELGAEYWGRNLHREVRFGSAVRGLLRQGYQVYVEVGPHAVLSGAVEECAGVEERDVLVVGSLRKRAPELAETLGSLGRLYSAGQRVRWAEVYGEGRGAKAPLPLYPWDRQRCWIEVGPVASPAPDQLLTNDEFANLPARRRGYLELARRWPVEGAAAINRKHLAPQVFQTHSGDALFYCSRTPQSVTALLYAGPEERHASAVAELIGYARANGLRAQVMVEERRLRHLDGVSATPAGILQYLPDLATFSLRGTHMRRLRYLVDKYAGLGRCSTGEYTIGTDPATDRRLLELAQEWSAIKGKKPAFLNEFRRLVTSGGPIAPLRLFVTRREGITECAILLSPAGPAGYLMDLELYGLQSGQGCLEFSIVQIIEQLRREGSSYFSLGGTYGTALNDHPQADPHVRTLLAELHCRNVLNGDSNAQFKNKFRPVCERIFVCREHGAGADGLEDVILMFGGSEARTGRLTATRLALPLAERIYEARLAGQDLSSLRHHRVDGQSVLPGAAYLELLASVVEQESGAAAWSVEGLTLTRPLYLAGTGETIVQIVLRNGKNGRPAFEIFSRRGNPGGSDTWTSHASGVLAPAAAGDVEEPERLETDALEARLEEVSIREFYEALAKGGTQYEGPFQRLESLCAGSGEALGLVAAEGPLTAAGLDAALQVLLAAQTAGAGGAGWMQGIERFACYRPVSGNFRSYARLRSVAGGRVCGDVRIYDRDDCLAIEMEGVSAVLRENVQAAPGNHSDLYTVEWRPADPKLFASGMRGSPRVWMVVADRPGAGDAVAAILGRRGVQVLQGTAQSEADYRNLIQTAQHAGDSVEGIVQLWGEGGAPPSLAESACRAALLLAQAVTVRDWTVRPKLWFVTQAAQSVLGEATELCLAPLWGFARVFATEHPEHYGGIADLDLSDESIDRFVAFLMSRTKETEIAIRHGAVYLPRLARVCGAGSKPVAICPDAAYLITGGLGGLGLASAKWLVERGARHICLVTRDPSRHADALQTVAEQRTRGANIAVEAADVADAAGLQAIVDGMSRAMPPLRGVIHASGIVGDGAISRLQWADFERVLRPKMLGAWNLHTLTQGAELDFFVLFSSAAGLLGPMGQASHAAESAFLDGLAHWRVRQGLPAMSIDWGPWSETASVADPAVAARLTFSGIRGYTSVEGMRVFEAALAHRDIQLAAIRINWLRWAAGAPHRRVGNLWSELGHIAPAAAEPVVSSGRAGEDSALYVRQRVGALLGIPAEHVDDHRPLSQYGFDSLMNISLRRTVEADWGVRIPIVHFFQSATLAELTEMVAGRLPAPQ